MGFKQVLHDAHLVHIPVHEPILDICDVIGWLWPVQLTILLAVQLQLLGPLRPFIRIVIVSIQAILMSAPLILLCNTLKMLPLKLLSIHNIVIFHRAVLHDLTCVAIGLELADCALYGAQKMARLDGLLAEFERHRTLQECKATL